jgi:hypothetical protein
VDADEAVATVVDQDQAILQNESHENDNISAIPDCSSNYCPIC